MACSLTYCITSVNTTKHITTILACLFTISFVEVTYCQADTTTKELPTVELSGFSDVFYVYDFNKPTGKQRQSFLFNHNRHNEFNLNLGLIKVSVIQLKYRANVSLHTGTYANDNYAAEPGLLKSIYEANIGILLNRKGNLWLDAGVLPSHIGFESAISSDNWTLTRSLSAENSPYYLSGVKLTYIPDNKWEIAGLIINGWQRIQQRQGNSLPSFGTRVNYRSEKTINFNWSTFIGTDDPDSTRRMRYFSNLYGQWQYSRKIGIVAGFDIGTQQKATQSTTYDIWFSPVIIGQCSISNSLKTALRVEYYYDKSGILVNIGEGKSSRMAGVSINLDYWPEQNICCRVEGRWLFCSDNYFKTETTQKKDNFIMAVSIAVKFSESFNRYSVHE